MKYIILLLVLVWSFLEAGVFDFMTLQKAKEAYEKGEYQKSAELYQEIAKEGSDEAKFNAADALYKAGEYQKALEFYQTIQSEKLHFKALHNIGNCYAHLGKIDKGIEAYEKALKMKEDKDTRFNLELLKKMKEQKEQKQQQNQQNNQNKNKNQKRNDNQNQNRQQKSNNQSNQDQKGHNQKQEKKDQSQQPSQPKEQQKSPSDKEQKPQKAQQPIPQKRDEPISEMEIRKWNKALNQRGIKTLMLPLPSKANERSSDETTPW